MTLKYALKLDLKICYINVKAQKIDSSIFKTFEMVLASFQVEDKLEKARFFQETFLLANINMEVVLGILFLILSNADIQFTKKELTQKTYTIAETLPTTKQVEFIDKKKFAKEALDAESKTFVIYVAALKVLLSEITIYLS